MKISKIMAGISALALAASMMAINVSATETQYLYGADVSWTGAAPTDSEEGTIKFTDTVKKGAVDINNWDSGATKYNGKWAQYTLTSDDLSGVTIDFKVVADDATTFEYHTWSDEKTEEEQAYELLLTLDKTETLPWADVAGQVSADTADMTMVTGVTGEWDFTYDGATIQAAVDSGKAKLVENEDGTYTLGFNYQIGHFGNAKVTGTITGDTLYAGASDGGSSNAGGDTNSSSKSGTTSSSKTDSTTDSKTDSKSSTTSSGAPTTSSKSGSANGTTSKTTTSGSSSAVSDNTNAGTGATAGLALAGIALAGAAIVVAKRK